MAHSPQLDGEPEDLALRIMRQGVKILLGDTLSFKVSSASHSGEFHINHAFTADQLALSKHTHPVLSLQRKYKHLHGLPLTPLHQVPLLLLIGSDHHHLISSIAHVRFGPLGGPAAVKTHLGWTLQSPTRDMQPLSSVAKCFNISIAHKSNDLYQNVERLWQLDAVPHRNERTATWSKLDNQAVNLLEVATERVLVSGVYRYATPLVRIPDPDLLSA